MNMDLFNLQLTKIEGKLVHSDFVKIASCSFAIRQPYSLPDL